LLFPQW